MAIANCYLLWPYTDEILSASLDFFKNAPELTFRIKVVPPSISSSMSARDLRPKELEQSFGESKDINFSPLVALLTCDVLRFEVKLATSPSPFIQTSFGPISPSSFDRFWGEDGRDEGATIVEASFRVATCLLLIRSVSRWQRNSWRLVAWQKAVHIMQTTLRLQNTMAYIKSHEFQKWILPANRT